MEVKEGYMAMMLMECVNNADLSQAFELLKMGANPNMVLQDGASPFHVAVGIEDIKMSEQLTRLMLEYGADPNVRSMEGSTPLHTAAAYGRADNLQVLLHNGGDPLLLDQDGMTVADNVRASGDEMCKIYLAVYHQKLACRGQGQSSPQTTGSPWIQSSGDNVSPGRWKTPIVPQLPLSPRKRTPLKSCSLNADLSPQYRKKYEMKDSPEAQDTYIVQTSYSDTSSVISPSDLIKQSHAYLHLLDHARTSPCTSTPDTSLMDQYSYYRLTDDDTIVSQNTSSPCSPRTSSTCSPRTTSSTLHEQLSNTRKLERALAHYDPAVHQIDVTSPDHPTLIHRSNTSLPLSQSSDSSDSFHTCASNESSEHSPDIIHPPIQSIHTGSIRSPHMSSKDICSTHQNVNNHTRTSDFSADNIVGFCPPTPQGSRLRQLSMNFTKDTFDFDGSKLRSVSSESSDSVYEMSRMSLYTDDSTILTETSKLSPSHRYAARTVTDNPWADVFPRTSSHTPSMPSNTSRLSLQSRSSRGSSACSCSSVRTERYLYTDREEGYSLIETRFVPKDCEKLPDINCSYHSQNTTIVCDWRELQVKNPIMNSPVSSRLSGLNNLAIHSKLVALGDQPGPVTDSTRSVYLRRLIAIEKDPSLAGKPTTPSQSGFLPEVTQAIDGALDLSDIVVRDLEIKMSDPFVNPDPSAHWREGSKKTSFTYLLLDPRVTQNLPIRSRTIGVKEGLECFIRSIFYIGKGVRSRPYAHFKEAIKHSMKYQDKTPGPKVSHIQEIWGSGLGVVSLHIFQNVIPCEAYTREACMIEAIGLSRLTNKIPGQHYGPASSWHMIKRRTLGVLLLNKAYRILLSEGERQIRPHDIKT